MSDPRTAGIAKLVGIVLAAFALTFSLVPLYRVACEKVFGIRLDNAPSAPIADAAASEKPARMVTVIFDGDANSKLPWAFHPEQASMQVRVGEQYGTQYFARNDGGRAIVGECEQCSLGAQRTRRPIGLGIKPPERPEHLRGQTARQQ